MVSLIKRVIIDDDIIVMVESPTMKIVNVAVTVIVQAVRIRLVNSAVVIDVFSFVNPNPVLET